MKKSRFAKIIGTGHYVPSKTVTNQEIDERYKQPLSAWIEPNVGVRERHFAAQEETTSDLAVAAARNALKSAKVNPEALDLLIVATDTPDYLSPATSSVVQHKLGAKNAGVFDVNNACAAFVSGLIIGSKFISTEPHYENILVIGAYGMSKFINWDDFKTATIFADGAGAVVLQAANEPGFLASQMEADGSYHDFMGIYVGGAYKPPTRENIEKGEHHLVIAKRFPPDLNATRWPPLVRSVVDKAGYTVSDIDRIYFTQINVNTIKDVMKTLELPLEKTHWIMDKWGYTGSACVAMALDDHIGQLQGPQPGDLVVFCASGGGYAMATAVFIW
jgi:3-oxoacyl-[acyl-carrier-protein] synthase-3